MSNTDPVYNELDQEALAVLKRLIPFLRKNTRHLSNEGDPAAIQDCWNSVEEIVDIVCEFVPFKYGLLKGKQDKEMIKEIERVMGDIVIIKSISVDCKHKGERRPDPLGGFFCVDCDSFINKK